MKSIMPKSKTSKAKSNPKPVRAVAGTGIESKSYKTTKSTGLTHNQKAALAHRMMVQVADLVEMEEAKLESPELVGIDRKLMGVQLSAWVSYLPGAFWDPRLPQPSRARGRRKI